MNSDVMLESTETSRLIIEERARHDIVVGVPHHAPAGVSRLPCPEHPASDENAGFIGRYLAERLGCCSVIACNCTIDPNKHLRSDYATQIAAWRPTVLVEIHGHGKTRSTFDVEISCGSADSTGMSESLASALRERLAGEPELCDVTVCGCFGEIYFKATKAVTIIDTRWAGYHIELSPRLRKPQHGSVGRPSPLAFRFCDDLVAAVRRRHG